MENIGKQNFNHLTKLLFLPSTEHFMDPEEKSHPKFDSVKNTEVSLYSACCQMEGKSVYKTTIAKAVEEKTIDNQTLGYFIARFVFHLIC